MGVPYYFYVLMKNYPKILHVTTPKECTDLFMDFNGAIHHAANLVLAEATAEHVDDAVLHKTWDYLQECIGIAKPSHMVHVCTDGVAPVAKMVQQRKRRYISAWKAAAAKATSGWDRNCISPGTPFMSRLQAFMAQNIRDDRRGDIHYYFSGADEAGEGEHKIFARISALGPESRVIVHGLDADLIMLSLMSHKPNIYLMREPSGAYKDLKTNDGYMYVEIDKLRAAILRDLHGRFTWPVPPDALTDVYSHEAKKIIETYVTVCSILGNDFLPHPVTLSLKQDGYDKLLVAAKRAWERSPNATGYDVGFLADIFKELAATEDADLWKCNENWLKRKPFVNEEDPLDSYPLQHKDRLCHTIFTKNPVKWRSHYYKDLFHSRLHDSSVVVNACKLFLQGITWVYRYYKRLSKDPEWYYPYNYAPSLRDMANFTMGLTPEESRKLMDSVTNGPASAALQFVHPHVQLLCIMPLASAPVLPRKVREVMQDPGLGCTHMFPTGFALQTYMKTHLWECTPILPMLDIACFKHALSEI